MTYNVFGGTLNLTQLQLLLIQLQRGTWNAMPEYFGTAKVTVSRGFT